MYMRKIRNIILILGAFLLTACYNHGPQTPDAWDLTEKQLDSISFFTTHHYTQNYNFVVNAKVFLCLTNPVRWRSTPCMWKKVSGWSWQIS